MRLCVQVPRPTWCVPHKRVRSRSYCTGTWFRSESFRRAGHLGRIWVQNLEWGDHSTFRRGWTPSSLVLSTRYPLPVPGARALPRFDSGPRTVHRLLLFASTSSGKVFVISNKCGERRIHLSLSPPRKGRGAPSSRSRVRVGVECSTSSSPRRVLTTQTRTVVVGTPGRSRDPTPVGVVPSKSVRSS